ncbi:glutamyl-Q tRNA(Asp) ligase [Rhizobium sp. Root268]|nr:glutamyl-Q tRNA(Asp) synthetase [Rhizobium sp. Root268]KQV39204.1 glutamyl-Q tRNA(Asp) ligase [Rhizobium sp. Root1212]KRD35178.1 glutamyl-Q tRNA(Asp) ligase [Rhizobium sp. Root268]
MTGILSKQAVFRFAPSPNGLLHLGHALSALINHGMAKDAGGRFLLRIEDIDTTRCRLEFEAAIYEDLGWLGLDWERPVRRQSEHFGLYSEMLERLIARGLAYPSFMSRSEIKAAVAEHEASGRRWPRDPDGAPHYPGEERDWGLGKRQAMLASGRQHAWRLDMQRALKELDGPLFWRETGYEVPTNAAASPFSAAGRRSGRRMRGDEGVFAANSEPAGPLIRPFGPPSPRGGEGKTGGTLASDNADSAIGIVPADPAAWGDIVLSRSDAPSSYHLAVTVDDALQGITHVVRGRDLFHATSVHRLLQQLLGLPEPVYHHHRLVLDAEGKKLSKSDGATGIAAYRAAGRSAADIRALLL